MPSDSFACVFSVQFCSQGGIDTINSALGSASSAQLYAAAISGILTTLVDVTEGEDVVSFVSK